MVEAVRSWYDTVYLPVIKAIKHQRVLRRFKNRTPSDLYVWLVNYWDDLKKDFGNEYPIDEAAKEFKEHFTENPFTNFFRRILQWKKRADIKEKI
jgi:hypothetical protein